MATPVHRESTARKHACRHDAHELRGQRAGGGRSCRHEHNEDRDRPEQVVRTRVRMVADDELDFVFRL